MDNDTKLETLLDLSTDTFAEVEVEATRLFNARVEDFRTKCFQEAAIKLFRSKFRPSFREKLANKMEMGLLTSSSTAAVVLTLAGLVKRNTAMTLAGTIKGVGRVKRKPSAIVHRKAEISDAKRVYRKRWASMNSEHKKIAITAAFRKGASYKDVAKDLKTKVGNVSAFATVNKITKTSLGLE